MSAQPPPRPQSGKNTVSIIGIVLGALGFFLPLILAPAGIVCGVIARSRGERLARAAIIVSVVCLVAGVVVNYLVFSSTQN